jgi:hypothetical protein
MRVAIVTLVTASLVILTGAFAPSAAANHDDYCQDTALDPHPCEPIFHLVKFCEDGLGASVDGAQACVDPGACASDEVGAGINDGEICQRVYANAYFTDAGCDRGQRLVVEISTSSFSTRCIIDKWACQQDCWIK